MKYDFNTIHNRRNTNSYKWNVKEGVLPMWVADMDFQTAPEIIESILKKVKSGILGYTSIPDEWNQATVKWLHRRHGLNVNTDWLIFATGVVPILSTAVRKFTNVGDNVVIQTPVYNIFFNSIRNNNRNIVENKLIYNNSNYSIDFVDLEEKLSDPKTTMMIICNPHNPIGKIWDKETLERIGQLCLENNVLLISDEIHADLTMPNKKYIPFLSLSEPVVQNSIVCYAPTKTFNLAGIHSAMAIVKNQDIRSKLNRALNTDEVAEPNAIAMEATIAAFTHGDQWLDELREVINENRLLVKDYFETHLPHCHLIKGDATYLLWIDCSNITNDTQRLIDFLENVVGLLLSSGEIFGESSKGFIRMNIACPKSIVEIGLDKLHIGIKQFIQNK